MYAKHHGAHVIRVLIQHIGCQVSPSNEVMHVYPLCHSCAGFPCCNLLWLGTNLARFLSYSLINITFPAVLASFPGLRTRLLLCVVIVNHLCGYHACLLPWLLYFPFVVNAFMYSQTSDSGPSEIGTQYNKPLYKGRFSRPQIIGLPFQVFCPL